MIHFLPVNVLLLYIMGSLTIFFLSYYLDRRDSLKRAANISLVDVAEADEGEIREMVLT